MTQHNTTQHNTTQHNTTQHNTTQHNLKLAYFLDVNKLKSIKRYGSQAKAYQDTVAEHCYMMTVIVRYLVREFKLNVDIEKVLDMIEHHDFDELGMEKDFEPDKMLAERNKNQLEFDFGLDCSNQTVKAEIGRRKIIQLQNRHGGRIMGNWTEYNGRTSLESRLVKAVDKIESTIHKVSCGVRNMDAKDFTATSPNEYVADIPEIAPFWRAVQSHVKAEYIKAGTEWKEVYDYDNFLRSQSVRTAE